MVQVPSVMLQFKSLNLKDISAAVVEEAGVVWHHDGSDILEGVDVGFDPSNIDDIQVICRLREKKRIWLDNNNHDVKAIVEKYTWWFLPHRGVRYLLSEALLVP